MGVVLAALHEHASTFHSVRIPKGIVADRVVYFGDTSKLAAYQSTNGSMFVEAIDRVQSYLDALWKSPPHRPHLLHGDFGTHNIMRHRGRLSPIDFQDLQFGFDLQDAAITITDLRRQFSDESLVDDDQSVVSAIDTRRDFLEHDAIGRKGADRIELVNDVRVERALAAARSLNVINLGLNLRRPGLFEFLDRHTAVVANWMSGLEPKTPLI